VIAQRLVVADGDTAETACIDGRQTRSFRRRLRRVLGTWLATRLRGSLASPEFPSPGSIKPNGFRCIPPPRQNLTRYHGVFAPNAKLRDRVVALARDAPPAVDAARPSTPAPGAAPRKGSPGPRAAYRLDWAALLKRIFRVDVLQCASCAGRMRMIAFVTKRDAVRRILRHLGLPDEPLPVERARGPPQPAFDW
jgi:hypothetical protein